MEREHRCGRDVVLGRAVGRRARVRHRVDDPHGEAATAGDFASTFAQSTLENWQSEFLQLFAFVSLAGLYIFKGSAESKDGEERLEASLRRIEERLGTLPPDAPTEPEQRWKLPDTPLQVQDSS